MILSLQVWVSAVADNSGRSGTLSSSVMSGGGPGAGLDVTAIHILGLTTGLADATNPTVTVNGGGGGSTVSYDSGKGVLKVEGLQGVKVNQPLNIKWQV